MPGLHFNAVLPDRVRRQALFAGDLLFVSATPASRDLCAAAAAAVADAFEGLDPLHAQEALTVEAFAARTGALKSTFTNADDTKRLVRAYLLEQSCDLERTFFDVPRLRVAPHSNYLTSGVSYAYQPHRDTWYSSPSAQVNWWLPVWDVTLDQTMTFHMAHWDRPLRNSSGEFDYREWVRVGRTLAASQIGSDTRKHPSPLEPALDDGAFRFSARSGDAILFSAAHLHATTPNTSGRARFSLDFRTVNLDDLDEGLGAPNLDSAATGATLGDFLKADDFSPLPQRLLEAMR